MQIGCVREYASSVLGSALLFEPAVPGLLLGNVDIDGEERKLYTRRSAVRQVNIIIPRVGACGMLFVVAACRGVLLLLLLPLLLLGAFRTHFGVSYLPYYSH